MVAHWQLWHWFWRLVGYGMHPLRGKQHKDAISDKPQEWVCRLARDIDNFVVARKLSVTFSKSKYIKHSDECEVTLTRGDRNLPSDTKEILKKVRAELVTVLASWFGFDTKAGADEARALMVDVLLRHVHPAVLYLPVTSRAFHNIRDTLRYDRRSRSTDFDTQRFVGFKNALAAHPVSEDSSKEAGELHSIGVIFGAGNQSGGLLPLVTEGQRVAYMHRFALFLRCLVPAVTQKPCLSDSTMVQRVAGDPDRYSPFREIAPGRSLAKSSYPFSDLGCTTHEGVFSAFVFRSVLFAAPCLSSDYPVPPRVSFDSLQDFQSYSADVPAEDITNIRAYGTPDPGRGPHHAPKLWKKAEVWEDLVDMMRGEGQYEGQETRITMTQLYRFFLRLRVPQMGSLGAYLLAADYSYTPVVQVKPTPTEVADLLFELDKGAVSGLQDIRLLPSGNLHFTREDVVEAFNSLFEYLEDELDEDFKAFIHFDAIMLEHALCKYRRLNAQAMEFPDVDVPDISTRDSDEDDEEEDDDDSEDSRGDP